MVVKTEYPGPAGVCDLVGGEMDPVRVEQRRALRQTRPVRDVTKLALLQLIPDIVTDEWVAIDLLGEAVPTGVTPERLAAHLDWLARHRYVVVDGDRVQKINGWAPLERRICAVELKLHNVREAIHQAAERLSFATEAFVAFPLERAKAVGSSSWRDALRLEGVGLLGVSLDRCELLTSPQRPSEPSHPILRALCVERFWAGASATRARRA
jgi:hypothetical protein